MVQFHTRPGSTFSSRGTGHSPTSEQRHVQRHQYIFGLLILIVGTTTITRLIYAQAVRNHPLSSGNLVVKPSFNSAAAAGSSKLDLDDIDSDFESDEKSDGKSDSSESKTKMPVENSKGGQSKTETMIIEEELDESEISSHGAVVAPPPMLPTAGLSSSSSSTTPPQHARITRSSPKIEEIRTSTSHAEDEELVIIVSKISATTTTGSGRSDDDHVSAESK